MHLSQNSFDHKKSAWSHKYLTTDLYNLFTLYILYFQVKYGIWELF